MTIYLPGDEVAITVNEATGEEVMAPAFTYGTSVVDNGGAYQGAYVSTDNELVQLGGVVKATADIAADSVIIKVASILAPRANELIKIEINGVLYSAEVDVNGNVKTKVSVSVGGTISLNNARFLSQKVFEIITETPPEEIPSNSVLGTAHLFTSTELLNGATIYGAPYEKPGYRVQFNGEVKLFGLLRVPNDKDDVILFKLPAEVAPAYTRIFTVQIGGDTIQGRLDILSSGDAVFRCTTISAPNFVCLDGISFHVHSTTM